jgi:ribosomal protein uS7
MFKARNSGKKLLAVRIAKDTFDIIHLLTDENPLQVFVKAIMNSGPREDSTRIGSAGVVRRQAVDVAPFRRVNQAIYLIAHGVRWISQFDPTFFCLCNRVCACHASPSSEDVLFHGLFICIQN